MGNRFREATFGEILSKEWLVPTELPSIAKDEDGESHWVEDGRILLSDIRKEKTNKERKE